MGEELEVFSSLETLLINFLSVRILIKSLSNLSSLYYLSLGFLNFLVAITLNFPVF